MWISKKEIERLSEYVKGYSDTNEEIDIRDNFIEFQELRDKCKYKDCMHYNDDHCAIKENVENGNIIKSRYENYIKFITRVIR